MNQEHMNHRNEMSDDEMNNVIGGLRTSYGSVPNRSAAERMANLKCSRCGAHIVFNNKSSYKTIGGEYVCKKCCE